MKRWSLALLALPLVGAGPASLIVGVVHDQYGRPIAGAHVRYEAQEGTTDASGTFALPAAGAAGTVVISCEYCRTKTVSIQPGEPVLAIVQRNDALAQETPSDRDVAALHYSGAASALTLRPYAVLNDSSTPLPGPRATLYGISTFWGGLLIDDGIPSYDVAAATSTFSFLPAAAAQRTSYGEPQDGFRYGDDAGAGTFFIDTRPDRGTSADAFAGGERGARFGVDSGAFAGSMEDSATAYDSRDRADASLRIPLGDDSLDATAIAASSRQFDSTDKSLDAAWNAARIAYTHNGPALVQASVIFDNSGYNGTLYEGGGVSAGWSDFEADASVQSGGAVRAFAGAGLRESTAFYSDPTVGGTTAGTLAQTRVDAGVQLAGSAFSATAGAGLFNFAYDGGTGGNADPLTTHVLSPSISLDYAVTPQWNAAFSSSDYFRLPSIAEIYAPPAATDVVPNKAPVSIAKLSYRDLRRLRLELVDVSGGVRAAGADLGWEAAPNIALRAWTYEFHNAFESSTATVNSLWATYENPGGLRIDAVERRDLIDGSENQHLDAAVSLPAGNHLRWYASTERRALTRLYRTGIELAP